MSASAGVAAMGESDTPSTLLVAADRALYGAKAGGRHRVGVWNGTVQIAASVEPEPATR